MSRLLAVHRQIGNSSALPSTERKFWFVIGRGIQRIAPRPWIMSSGVLKAVDSIQRSGARNRNATNSIGRCSQICDRRSQPFISSHRPYLLAIGEQAELQDREDQHDRKEQIGD